MGYSIDFEKMGSHVASCLYASYSSCGGRNRQSEQAGHHQQIFFLQYLTTVLEIEKFVMHHDDAYRRRER